MPHYDRPRVGNPYLRSADPALPAAAQPAPAPEPEAPKPAKRPPARKPKKPA